MQILDVAVLRGPNIWANFPVLEALVELGPWKDLSSEMIPGFNERLKRWLPSLVEHRCSEGVRGGFFQRLDRGTYFAHILEHVTLELQTLAGCDVGFGRARETDVEGTYFVAIEYADERVALECLARGREIVLAAAEGREIDAAAIAHALRELAEDEMLGPSTTAIVRAAQARGIPYRRLNRESLVQLGHGALARRVLTAETDRTGAIAETIAQDKELTRSLLAAIGAPVPVGRAVSDADDAWRAAQEIGLPVVVKPRYGNHGRGVATNLQSKEQVASAWRAAREEGKQIIVESFAPGDDHRLLVIGGKLVAAARREPAHVVGDGRSSIGELVEAANRDVRRGNGHATTLSKIKLDAVALSVLADQNLSVESVPVAGQKILIRLNGNLSTGGTATDVTDRVHPEVAATAIAAAAMVGLDIAGIDIVATDIGRPLGEQRGAIVEVNAGPGLRMHLTPSEGKSRPVGEAIIEMLYPNAALARLPIVAMSEGFDNGEAVAYLSRLFSLAGKAPRVCSRQVGVYRYLGGRRDNVSREARDLLLDPGAEAAIFEVSAEMALRQGLPFDRCDVAIVFDIERAGQTVTERTTTPERLLRVKRTLIEALAARGAAVLSAAEPFSPELAASCRGEVIYISRESELASKERETIAEHLGRGGRAVIFREGVVELAKGNARESMGVLSIQETGWEAKLAAVAAGWALGFESSLLANLLLNLASAAAGDEALRAERHAEPAILGHALRDREIRQTGVGGDVIRQERHRSLRREDLAKNDAQAHPLASA